MTAADDLADFWVHTVTVTTLTGSTGMGNTYATPVTATGLVEEKRRLVLNPDAVQVISEATYYAPPAQAATFTPGSKVTLPSGRVATVITSGSHTSGDLDLPDHVQVALT